MPTKGSWPSFDCIIPGCPSMRGHLAPKVLLLVRAALTGVHGWLRIGAHRTRPRRGAGRVAGDDPLRRMPGTDPAVDARDGIDHRGPIAAPAVPHAGNQEQARIDRLLGSGVLG